MTYALITLNAPFSEYLGFRRDFSSTPPTLAPEKNMQWVPVVVADPVNYDPATHKLTRISDLVEVDQVTVQRTQAVALTQAELDALAEEAAAESEREAARQAYLDLKNATGTTAERLRRVELVLARIVRDRYGPEA